MAMRQHDAIRPKDRVDGRRSGKKKNGQTNKIHLSIRFGGASGSRTLAPVSRPIAFRVLPASQYSVEHSGSYPTLPEDTNHRDYAQNFIKVRKI